MLKIEEKKIGRMVHCKIKEEEEAEKRAERKRSAKGEIIGCKSEERKMEK